MPRSEWTAVAGREAGASLPAPTPASVWSGARERELTLHDAEQRVLAEINTLGWHALDRVLDDSEPTAIQCALRHADGTEVPYGLGAGKGLSGPAQVGARFEALEHALSGPAILDSLDVRLRTAGDLLSEPVGCERGLQGLGEQPDASLACLPYTALDGGPDFDVPLALWAAWYLRPSEAVARQRARLGDTTDYRPVLSYSTNTGCAIGATYDEALLHALNEWAERDALSLFLLRSVYDRGPMPGRVPRAALPGFLRQRLDRAAEVVDSPVVLLDLTTDLNIPVVMAYAPALAGNEPRYFGLGASLSGETAVERATTEFVQAELALRAVAEGDAVPAGGGAHADHTGQPDLGTLVNEEDVARDLRARFAAYPRLLACAQLDFADRVGEAPLSPTPPETVPRVATVAQQRFATVERITAAGHRVAAHTLHTLAHGTTVVQVQCPGLERFHQVVKALLALPGARGRRLRHQTSARTGPHRS